MQPRFHRANRAAQQGGDFRQGGIPKEAQQDNSLMLVRQAFNYLPQLVRRLLSHGGLSRRGAGGRGVFLRLLPLVSFRRGQRGEGNRTGAGAAERLLVPVEENGKQPGAVAAGAVVAANAAPGLDKRLGNQVLGSAQLMSQAARLLQQTAFMRRRQLDRKSTRL